MVEKRYIVKGTDDFFQHIEDTTLTEDKHEGAIYNIYQVIDKLNEQDEQIKKLEKENKFLRCTIESNSQDDYIDYLEKQSKRLEARITKLEKKEQDKEKDNVIWALNQFKYKEKTETEQEAFLILEKAFKKILLR